jgi:hypothetical protein
LFVRFLPLKISGFIKVTVKEEEHSSSGNKGSTKVKTKFLYSNNSIG